MLDSWAQPSSVDWALWDLSRGFWLAGIPLSGGEALPCGQTAQSPRAQDCNFALPESVCTLAAALGSAASVAAVPFPWRLIEENQVM